MKCPGPNISGDEIEPHYGGRGVRIRVCWTKPYWSSPYRLLQSLSLITYAHNLLSAETLSLDVEPEELLAFGLVPISIPRDAKLPVATKNPFPRAFLEFDKTLDLTDDGHLEDYVTPIRSLVDRFPPREDRLIVVFTPLAASAGIGGHTFTFASSLPWVIVGLPEPKEPLSTTPTWSVEVQSYGHLIHEIGHACRLNHGPGIMNKDAGGAPAFFCNWQVHEIYKSYWCAGPRPKNWWVRARPLNGPYLWGD